MRCGKETLGTGMDETEASHQALQEASSATMERCVLMVERGMEKWRNGEMISVVLPCMIRWPCLRKRHALVNFRFARLTRHGRRHFSARHRPHSPVHTLRRVREKQIRPANEHYDAVATRNPENGERVSTKINAACCCSVAVLQRGCSSAVVVL